VKRARTFLTALAGFGGMLLLAGASQGQGPGGPPPGAPPGAQPAPGARPTIAVFNMAAVMRDYGKAKYQVYMLNKKRNEMSADLVKWKAEYVQLQQDIQKQQQPDLRDQMAKKMVALARQIEDKDREINKALNDDASAIISQLYDDIKTVVDKTAEMNGYHIVFAYPDAVTAEEMKNPMVKELKLKPPAAQPFYVAKHVDVTGVVIQTLNAWYPSPAVPADAPPTGAPSTTPPGGAPPAATPGAPPAPPVGGVPPGTPGRPGG
jgi:Skp family chaperone for outer membrane proteins